MSVGDRAPGDDELLAWVRRGPIVTRTNRLAREVRSRIADATARSGVTVFETPEVLPIGAWLAELWESSEPDSLVLSEPSERVLWQEIIRADDEVAERNPAADVTLLAKSAMTAWARICLWYEPPWRDFDTVLEVRVFGRWVAVLRSQLAAQQWLTTAELAAALTKAVAAGRVTLPRHLTLIGFERMEPVTRRLLEALGTAGVAVLEPAVAGTTVAPTVLLELPDAESEVRWVVASIRRDLEARPGASIGVLAADLSAYRPALERHLTCELDAAGIVPSAGEALPRLRRVFDLAGAPALADHGIVAGALDMLRLAARANPFELVSRILLSPYPRDADADVAARRAETQAAVEAALRRKNRLFVGLVPLADVARDAGALELARALASLSTILAKQPHAARPSVWARQFVERLRCFGWPGTEIDHQGDEGFAYGRWRDAVDAMAALDPLRSSMTAAEALSELGQLCAETTVQAASDGLNVQAMGLLDASGLRFDKAYVLGMTAERFPSPARPHPLLPAPWQRRMGMPLSSPDVEGEFANAVWRRVSTSTDELVVTWPRLGENGEALAASPLVRRASDRIDAVDAVDVEPWYAGRASGASTFDEPDPGHVPPALIRRGGTGMLTDHSACPFKSFASRRLAVDGLEEPEPEPSAKTRGDLVHRTLEAVWALLGDSDALRALDDARLHEVVREAAERAVRETPSVHDEAASADPLAQWLTEQTAAWLRHERDGEREHWTIAAVEEHTEVPLGGHGGAPAIVLGRLRVDRIDALADGSALVIDYKTSSRAKTSKAWEGERPEEPQLPIYAVALADLGRKVSGLAFANLSGRDDVGFSGIAGDVVVPREIVPKKQKGGKADATWNGMDAQIDDWRVALSSLAEDYAAGNARVDPRKPSEDCRYCGRDSLCRKFELDLDSGDEDAGTDDG